VVVGGVAAGLSAASQARRADPRLEIVVFEKGPDISYSACGLPYFIAGQVEDASSLRVHSPEFFRKERNIEVHTGREVVEIVPGRRRVVVMTPDGTGHEEVPYRHLVLATGAEPARPDVPGLDLDGVFHVNDLQATLRLERFLETERPRSVVVVGGGYIGLEMADALVQRGLKVTVLDRSERLFEAVDEELSLVIDRELASYGVEVRRGARVTALVGDAAGGRVRRVITDTAGALETGCVVLATGVRPRTNLAEAAGITLGTTGAIAVDERMETDVSAVFAAGDCAETRNLVSSRPAYLPLGTTANKQGRVAGENAAGGRARFPGIVGTAAVKVFDQEVARTGLCDSEAREAGFRTATAVINATSRSRYLGGQPMLIKMVADRASGRLLGAQMAGREGVAKRIDVVATALHARFTVDQVARLDLSYAPPFSTVWDPVLITAQELLKLLKR
jgi:NADPH-dependent 2,4-dienoyl-CoA reductase/sulfur reductase-like enzyme